MSTIERMHAWSHLVLFMMVFMITLAVMRFSAPTGLATNNQSITAQNVGDLKPFLTAVGLMMGMLIAILIAVNANLGSEPRPMRPVAQPRAAPGPTMALHEINKHLADIRSKLRR